MASARSSWLEQGDHIDMLLANEAARVEETQSEEEALSLRFAARPAHKRRTTVVEANLRKR
jgi:hypothetical protein